MVDGRKGSTIVFKNGREQPYCGLRIYWTTMIFSGNVKSRRELIVPSSTDRTFRKTLGEIGTRDLHGR